MMGCFLRVLAVVLAGFSIIEAQAQTSDSNNTSETSLYADWFVKANQKIFEQQQKGQFKEALAANAELQKRVEQAYGTISREAALNLSKQGNILSAAGQHAEAMKAYENALKRTKAVFGSNHSEVAIANSNLAGNYAALGRINDADALFESAIGLVKRVEGTGSETYRQILDTYSNFTTKYGDKTAAETQVKRLIVLTRKLKGEKSTELIRAQQKLGWVFALAERWDDLKSHVTETINESVARHGEGDTFTIQLIADFAKIYSNLSRNQEAAKLYARVVRIAEGTFGPEHRFTVANYILLAGKLQETGAHDEAVSYFDKALTHWQKAFGENPKGIHDLYVDYGASLRRLARFEEAEAAFLAAIAASKKAFGEYHSYNGKPYMYLAGLYKELGRFSEAESNYKIALNANLRRYGGEHTDIALVLDNIGVLYRAMGRFDNAEEYSTRSLEMYERLSGPDNSHVIYVLNNLASIYMATGRNHNARDYLLRALNIINSKPTMRGHPIIPVVLDNLAIIYSDWKQFERAMELRKRAYDFFYGLYGKDRLDTAIAAQNLGALNFEMKKYDEAEGWFLQALGSMEVIYSKQSASYATALGWLSNVRLKRGDDEGALKLARESLAVMKETLPADHPDLIRALIRKGDIHLIRKEFRPAYDSYAAAAKIIINRAQSREMNDIRRRIFEGIINASASLDGQIDSTSKEYARISFDAAQQIGNSKASEALAQMSARFASGDDALAKTIRQQQDIEERLATNETRLTNALARHSDKRDDALINTLRGERQRLVKSLSALNNKIKKDFPAYFELSRPQPVTTTDLQKLLAPDEVFIQYSVGVDSSYVWIVKNDDISWYRLKLSADQIQDRVARLRCGLDGSNWTMKSDKGKCNKLLRHKLTGNSLPFNANLSFKFFGELIGPFAQEVTDKHLIIVPSGALTSLPFQILITEQPDQTSDNRSLKWLAKSNPITIMPAASSMKSLRQFVQTRTASLPYIGYGDPVLKGVPSCPKIKVPTKCSNPLERPLTLANLVTSIERFFRAGKADTAALSSLCPLPDTTHELKCVAQSMGADADTVHTQMAATEPQIKAVSEKGELQNYRVVHFATHGLLSGETQHFNKALAEPALVLTPPDEAADNNDGLLTASEVAQLKLNADWVVLSACNTAGGDNPGAEALSGLARAFIYAGARALLVSHWPVNSDAAVKLTTGAFMAMREDSSIGRAEAMRQSITALIENGARWESHPANWAPFIVVGDGGR